MAAETTQEPTMEEILASIRRIISEEDGAPAPAAPPIVEDVLELSAPEPMQMPEPEPIAAAPAPAPMPAPQVTAIEDLDVIDVVEPVEAPVYSMPATDPDEGLIGEPALESALGSFGRLAAHLPISENPNQTLEGVVQDLMRPMLKQWLDANLPRIVEEKVEAEILRLSRVVRRAK